MLERVEISLSILIISCPSHLPRMRQGLFADSDPSRHAGHFGHALFILYHFHRGAGIALVSRFTDIEVVMPLGGNLRLVGHTKHLTFITQAAQTISATPPPTPASTSSKISVGIPPLARCDHLNRQTDARKLATGGDLVERTLRLAGIGADLKFHRLLTMGAGDGFDGG